MGNLRDRRPWLQLRHPAWALLALALLALAACAPIPKEPPPLLKTPSKVISEGGLEFFVYKLKFPGTNQELRMQVGDSQIWVPMASVRYLLLQGPEQDRYRQAEVALTTGEKFRGKMFVDGIIEGSTDLGYWNMSLKDVRQLSLGED